MFHENPARWLFGVLQHYARHAFLMFSRNRPSQLNYFFFSAQLSCSECIQLRFVCGLKNAMENWLWRCSRSVWFWMHEKKEKKKYFDTLRSKKRQAKAITIDGRVRFFFLLFHEILQWHWTARNHPHGVFTFCRIFPLIWARKLAEVVKSLFVRF